MRTIGTSVYGIRCPIIKQGDDLSKIVTDAVLNSGIELRDRDVIAITESVVARSAGNYASVDDIAEDVARKFPNKEAILVYPILSRNRFAICLKGIARGLKKVTLFFSFPKDEVGNSLMDENKLWSIPWAENSSFSYEDFKNIFGEYKHPFTGMDYVKYYKKIVEDEGAACRIYFSNNPADVFRFYSNDTTNVLLCDIHTRGVTRKKILNSSNMTWGRLHMYDLTDVLSEPIGGSGFNENYGLLGSNKATEDEVKLFPRKSSCEVVVGMVQKNILEKTGKHVEVMVYGDGAFKDPVGKIWELADPVVSPAHTPGLRGTPNELKLKYLADNDFGNLKGEELEKAIEERIKSKEGNLVGNMASEGTTPRQLTDLLGSLSDLTSGSGDKGTPVILIQGYFDNYTTE